MFWVHDIEGSSPFVPTMFAFTGILTTFVEQNNFKLIVEVDSEISNYYRSLIPKYCRVNRQRYTPHISVVREESIIHLDRWNLLQGKTVICWYNNVIFNDETYFWLEVNSLDLQTIRVKLGLTPTNRITRSPNGEHSFHITLGNTK